MPESPFRRRSDQSFLNVNTTPSADCYLDGRLIGATPLSLVPVRAGTHTLKFVSATDSITRTVSVSVSAGETKNVFQRLQGAERRRRE
jgi:hypothetical protein